MEYTVILNALNEASAFDLFRLQIAIDKELNNPQRIMKVKQSLRIGMETTYFDAEKNCLVPVRIVELKRSNVVVSETQNLKRKTILPYFMLNISNVDPNIYENKKKLTANNLSVGEIVGFNNKGNDIIGMIERLNQKTVSLVSTTGGKWRVGYGALYRVHNAESAKAEILKHLR